MKKVIIIDDSIAQLNLMKIFFENNSWEVYCAQNATYGYEMIFNIAPDLIITDAIMPKNSGFQLVHQIRENSLISKIPIIVYSILGETSAKFYLKQNLGEFYLKKSDNLYELLNLAKKVIQDFKIRESYKSQIFQNPIEKEITKCCKNFEVTKEIKPIIENIFIEIDEENLSSKLKEISNFSLNDEELLENFFSILYPILKYDLALTCVYSFEEKQKKLFFDIKDIILSPIFQSAVLKKYSAQNSHFYKKYTPNLKTITDENEFRSKIELNFSYQEKEIANVVFYSREENKYQSVELNILKNLLERFFQARFSHKNSQSPKTSQDKKYSYFKPNLPFLNIFNNALGKNLKQEIFISILQITNFAFLKETNSDEGLDILNLKITEKIIGCLDVEEQLYKNDDGEYVLMLLGKDEKQIYNKMRYIIDSINLITDENQNNIDGVMSASNCTINDEFSVYEARKTALEALDLTNKYEKVIIK